MPIKAIKVFSWKNQPKEIFTVTKKDKEPAYHIQMIERKIFHPTFS